MSAVTMMAIAPDLTVVAVHHLWLNYGHTDPVTDLDDDAPTRFRRLPESTRVEAFSDGVFAIAVTLLVLDLHSPSGGRGQFLHDLIRQWPAYVANLAA
ncbi:MAG: TMEM175 family protein, partial [Ilumatobacteraceae bacterium]